MRESLTQQSNTKQSANHERNNQIQNRVREPLAQQSNTKQSVRATDPKIKRKTEWRATDPTTEHKTECASH